MISKISAKNKNMETIRIAIEKWFATGKTYGPSYRDLVELSGLPIGTIHKTCAFLRNANIITFDDKIARSIRLTKENNEQL